MREDLCQQKQTAVWKRPYGKETEMKISGSEGLLASDANATLLKHLYNTITSHCNEVELFSLNICPLKSICQSLEPYIKM